MSETKKNLNENQPRRSKSEKPGSLPYIWNYIKHNKSAMAGLFFLVGLFIISFLTPYIFKYNYRQVDVFLQYLKPCAAHPFGCDEVGRDLLVRVLYGAKYTLSIGLIATAGGGLTGILLGAISGYFGGKVDSIIMRCLDVFQSFPTILLAIAISAALGPGYWKLILACGIAGIPGYARMMRANTLTIRSSEYIEAATSINCPTPKIILKHVIPNAISPMIVLLSMGVANAALVASSLSFLGFGVVPPTPEWGVLLSSGRSYILQYPHMVVFPGLFIMLTVLSFNLIGDALRDALDPKLRN